MSSLRAAVLGAMCAIVTSSIAAAGDALQLEAKIPLGNVAGRIDHMAVDLARKRLFVAELGNNTIGIVDLEGRKVLQRLTGLKEPQGVAYVAETETLYVANRGDGSVRMFRGADYTPAGRIELHSDADNVRVDPSANHVIVGYGSGGLAVISAADNKHVLSMPLKAHPESFQLDPKTSDVFVNLPDERAIVVLDRRAGQPRQTWRMGHGSNFAMTLDNDRERVLTLFRDPPKLAAFVKENGAPAGEADTCGDADDLFFDAKRRRVYVSCGEGFIDVLDARDAGFARLSRIATVAGARTSLWVPEEDRLFLAVRAQAGQSAAIWVYRAGE
jgi:DNA-binding beta-propeller fold protein YncE